MCGHLIADTVECSGMYPIQSFSFLEKSVLQHALQQIRSLSELLMLSMSSGGQVACVCMINPYAYHILQGRRLA